MVARLAVKSGLAIAPFEFTVFLKGILMIESLDKSILRLLHKGFSDNRINCFRCGVCCRYGVSMGAEDAELIGKNIGKPVQAFLIGYSHNSWLGNDEDTWLTNGSSDIDWIDELDNYRTKRNDSGCIFLKTLRESNEMRCSIHTVRPPACRGYAPEIDREACVTGLKMMWGITVTTALGLEGSDRNLARFYAFLISLIENKE